MNISQLVKPSVYALQAYEAKELPSRVKLDANESPYGIADTELAKIFRKIRKLPFNRYPDPEARGLRGLLAKGNRVRLERILLGNGSDELISLLVTTFGGPVLYPVPTFSMYGIISRGLGEETVEVPLDSGFDLDVDKMRRALRKHRPKILFLSSPNNPTGNCYSEERILEIIRSHRGVAVVDEAYQPYSSQRTFVSRLNRHKNLVVLQTLSKVGLASLRVGFMIASQDITREVNKVRLPFNVNALSQEVALEVLSGRGLRPSAVEQIVQERTRMFRSLKHLPCVNVFPSDANFILFKVNDANKVHAELLRNGILVRNMDSTVSGCLRVTVGTPRQNAQFLGAMRKVLS